ncbi:MAG: GTPase [Candidatus Hermodarchaeia archaeon]|jgi:ribosome-interacting GTPase 1
MPVNLTAEAQAAQRAYEEASGLEERIEKLEKFISLIPKHKSSEKMVALYRHRLTVLRQEQEERRVRRKMATGGPSYSLAKEGAGQVVLVGVTNSGKSALLNRLTGAKAKIGDYEFTTQLPEPGILKYGGTDIQIIDMPALFEGAINSSIGRQILGGIRNADLIILVVDLSVPPKPQVEFLITLLEESRIKLNKPPPPIRFAKTGSGGTNIVGGTNFQGDPELIRQLLRRRRIHNFSLQFRGPATLDDLVEVIDSRTTYIPSIIIATKGDSSKSSENFEKLQEEFGDVFPIFPVSVEKDIGIRKAATGIFERLKVMRIFTRKSSGEIGDKPLILPIGSNVEDLAKRLHSDFHKNFRYAIVYRMSTGQIRKKVGFTFVLEDQDVIQIFTS